MEFRRVLFRSMHRLSHGRYALGLGRGFDVLFDVMGLPRVTGAQLEDAMDIYRRLWRGEAVAGHDGPAGQFPWLQQDATQNAHIPILMMALGARSLELAVRIADGVGLPTFFTDDTPSPPVAPVPRAPHQAG